MYFEWRLDSNWHPDLLDLSDGLALGGGLESWTRTVNYRTLAQQSAIYRLYLEVLPRTWFRAGVAQNHRCPKSFADQSRAVQVIIGNALNNNTTH
jgi:hypothetical protein